MVDLDREHGAALRVAERVDFGFPGSDPAVVAAVADAVMHPAGFEIEGCGCQKPDQAEAVREISDWLFLSVTKGTGHLRVLLRHRFISLAHQVGIGGTFQKLAWPAPFIDVAEPVDVVGDRGSEPVKNMSLVPRQWKRTEAQAIFSDIGRDAAKDVCGDPAEPDRVAAAEKDQSPLDQAGPKGCRPHRDEGGR